MRPLERAEEVASSAFHCAFSIFVVESEVVCLIRCPLSELRLPSFLFRMLLRSITNACCLSAGRCKQTGTCLGPCTVMNARLYFTVAAAKCW